MASDSAPKLTRDPLSIEQMSINRRIDSYKQCCYRAYAYGLAALSIVSSASYFALRRFPLPSNQLVMISGCIGSVAGYMTSKEKSKECNLILKAHRESMRNPVKPDGEEQKDS